MQKNLVQKLYKVEDRYKNPFGYTPETIRPDSAVYNFVFKIAGKKESFNWRPYAPVRERQYWIPFCVSFSRLNIFETLANKDGTQINLSDRELGVISGTTLLGNSLETVAETFRKIGVRTEKEVPFTDRMINFGGDDIWKEIFDLPKDNGEKRYKGGSHSWVVGKAAMIDALEYSPLQIAVPLDGNWEVNGIVKPPKTHESYHAVMLMYIDQDGNMYIQDSIGKEFKTLSPDYPITGCKSFRDLPENWKEIMANKYLIKQGEKIGVLVTEGFTFGGGFAKDMQALEQLKSAFEFKGNEPTIELPIK